TEQAQETTVSVNSVSFTYPILTAVAFHAADGGESTIIVMNRDLENERSVTVDLPADPQGTGGSIYAPSTYDENASFTKPGVESWTDFEINGTQLTATIPRHSVAAIRLTWP
ncbi:hypothetical protein KDL45_04930, partial [bacterium]|nr:hypothetical protein [bacterium]